MAYFYFHALQFNWLDQLVSILRFIYTYSIEELEHYIIAYEKSIEYIFCVIQFDLTLLKPVWRSSLIIFLLYGSMKMKIPLKGNYFSVYM